MIDLAISGGGPGGYVAAERAGAKGLNVVLFEKRELGGVCLNEGCIPTKTLLYSAKVYDYAKHGDKYGVSAPGATFDFGKIVRILAPLAYRSIRANRKGPQRGGTVDCPFADGLAHKRKGRNQHQRNTTSAHHRFRNLQAGKGLAGAASHDQLATISVGQTFLHRVQGILLVRSQLL